MSVVERSSHAERIHAMDALRALAMLLGLVTHGTEPYLQSVPGSFRAFDPVRHWGFDIVYLTVHTFRMPLFFVLAGFFAHLLYRKLGFRGFLANRAVRVLMPLVLGIALLIPVGKATWTYAVVTPNPPPTPVELTLQVAQILPVVARRSLAYLGHLWFLWYLLIFYLCALLALAAGRLSGRAPPGALETALPSLLTHPAKPLLLATAIFPFMLFMGKAWRWDNDLFLYSRLHVLGYFAVFYVFGWAMYRHRELLPRMLVGWRINLAVGFGLLLPLLLGVLMPASKLATGHELLIVDLLARAVASLSVGPLVFGLMGGFLHYFNRPGGVMRYLSDAGYWVYLTHWPLIPFLNLVAVPWALPGGVKVIVVILTTACISLLTYQLCVRHTIVGWMLNGRRPGRETRSAVGGVARVRTVRV